MKKSSACESGAFNPRIFAAFLLCAAGGWLAMLSFASTPSTGTIDPSTNPPQNNVSYTAGPFFVSNPTPIIEVDSGPAAQKRGMFLYHSMRRDKLL